MRTALLPRHRSPFVRVRPARLRAPTSPRLGSRPRASGATPGLSTRTMPMARFSEPDSGPTTSATRTTHGHETRVVVTRPLAGRRISPRRVCRRASPCGDSRGDEPLSRRPPKRTSRADRPNRDEVPCLLGLGVPRSPRTAHLRVARTLARRAEPFEPQPRLQRAHPMSTLAGRASRGLRSRTDPRRPMRSHEDRGAFDRRSARPFEEIALPARSSGPPSTRPVLPSVKKSVRAFATWSASASFTAPWCPA